MKNTPAIFRIALLMLLFVATVFEAQAQSPAAPSRMQLIIKPLYTVSTGSGFVLGDPFALMTSADTVCVELLITLADTNQLDSLSLRLGTSQGANDRLDLHWPFDATPSGSGMTYLRTGNLVRVGLGLMPFHPALYAEVKLQDINGNLSPAASCNSTN